MLLFSNQSRFILLVQLIVGERYRRVNHVLRSAWTIVTYDIAFDTIQVLLDRVVQLTNLASARIVPSLSRPDAQFINHRLIASEFKPGALMDQCRISRIQASHLCTDIVREPPTMRIINVYAVLRPLSSQVNRFLKFRSDDTLRQLLFGLSAPKLSKTNYQSIFHRVAAEMPILSYFTAKALNSISNYYAGRLCRAIDDRPLISDDMLNDAADSLYDAHQDVSLQTHNLRSALDLLLVSHIGNADTLTTFESAQLLLLVATVHALVLSASHATSLQWSTLAALPSLV